MKLNKRQFKGAYLNSESTGVVFFSHRTLNPQAGRLVTYIVISFHVNVGSSATFL